MSFTPTDRVACGPDAEFVVGEDRHGHLAVFDGPGGLETSIRFDQVWIDRTIEFSRLEWRKDGRARIGTGSIEAAPRLVSLLESALDETDVEIVDEREGVSEA